MAIVRLLAVSLTMLLTVGCGGDDFALCDGCGLPTPTPTATATPSPSATPTPTPTPTP